MESIAAYGFTLLSLISLDGIWLAVVARQFYSSRLGFLFSDHIAAWPLIIFYPLYAAGLWFFAVHPALASGGSDTSATIKALLLGAFIGLLSYTAYDLTNQATISGWPITVTVVDILWGVVLSGLASMIATRATQFFFR